jgi:uncharacterized protein
MMLPADIGTYVALGFAAQLVDGALGMAYGVISTSVLLALGMPPALASASVHTAEMVTTGLAGLSHVWHQNIDWRLVRRLAPAGALGGMAGAFLLVSLPEQPIKLAVTIYLLSVTLLIGWRVVSGSRKPTHLIGTIPLGAGGGFLDAIGGGGWGPLVTSTLIARGDSARHSIGSVSLSELFVTIAISSAFIAALDFSRYWRVVLGLIIGGALAAPLAGWLSKVLPHRLLMLLVALAVGTISVYNLVQFAASN